MSQRRGRGSQRTPTASAAAAGKGISRRHFLAAGAGIAAQTRLPILRPRDTRRGYNVVVLMTDQERFPAHWPAGWAEANLPAMQRLRSRGLTFERAYTAAAECSPSRAVMLTAEHAKINGVSVTLRAPGMLQKSALTNVASLLQSRTDYQVVWKGKWHLSYSLAGTETWTQADIAGLAERFGPLAWNPPDAGTAVGANTYGISTMGGGLPNNDGRYVMGPSADDPDQTPGFGQSVLDFLAEVGRTPRAKRRPFCLFVSLVNPHDVSFFPTGWEEGGYVRDEFAGTGIGLPSNFADDLLTKPSVQRRFREVYDANEPLDFPGADLDYVNFYAYLHKLVDGHVGTVLDALDFWELTDDTIVIRLADHGEMGLSHGLRQKSYTAYEETIHVPLVVSNPRLYPTALSTDAFYCHLDLLPTIAEIAGLRNTGVGRGVSLVPVLNRPWVSVQDGIVFTFDDVFALPADVPGGHIRALRTEDWTYAVYFSLDGSSFEYELYDLASDPGQLDNLLYEPSLALRAEWRRLHARLTDKLAALDAIPDGVVWPVNPAG